VRRGGREGAVSIKYAPQAPRMADCQTPHAYTIHTPPSLPPSHSLRVMVSPKVLQVPLIHSHHRRHQQQQIKHTQRHQW